MNRDLSEILDEWPYQPGQLNVRLIEGVDGRPRIQIRLDLGVLQMMTEGRPDGQAPFGYDSLLEYFEARADGIEPPEPEPEPESEDEAPAKNAPKGLPAPSDLEPGKASGSRKGRGQIDPVQEPALEDEDEEEEIYPEPDENFRLSSDDCRLLREEAVQYYHRYMAMLALEDYEAVIRDTTRNLRVIDFCRARAENESDRNELEPYRPYMMMIRARAMASQAMRDHEPKAAIVAIDEGLEALRRHFESRGEPEMFEDSNEAALLRSMKVSLMPKLPVSQKAELKQRLQAAIVQENYELAAILRDELRSLGEG